MALTLFYVLFIALGLRFFAPETVGMALTATAAPWSAYLLARHRISDAIVPVAATALGVAVWVLNTAMILQVLPVLISGLFFLKFGEAVLFHHPFLADMVRKVPKLNLSDAVLAYINRSHVYWLGVTGLNTAIQILVVFAPLQVWALYTTAGWYLLFALALGLQIIYGRMHGVE